MLLAVLVLHVVAAVVAPAASRPLGRRTFLLVAVAPALTLVALAWWAPSVLDGDAVDSRTAWVPALDLGVDLRLDAFGWLLAVLVSGVGVLVLVFSRSYFPDTARIGTIAGLLVAFAGAMLGLVLADNLLLLYVCWELTSITSYLLIGIEDERGDARAAALQALLVTSAGGLAMLAGFVLLAQEAGTYRLSELVDSPPSGGTVPVALALVLLGAFTKSAQVPFHGWLPGAMAAPTPVSTYLHSATMVKAGVYLIARFAPAFADGSGFWRPAVVTVGLATMLLGGLRALRQQDLKLLLAHGTVSQLGFMVVLLGAGHPELAVAGTALLLGHALFKGALFMVVGVVDHQAGTRSITSLTGLARRLRGTFVVTALAAASMVGLPPLAGFVAKEAALEGLLEVGGVLTVTGVVAGSILTFAYGARFVWGAFGDKRASGFGDAVGPDVPRPAPALVAPAAVLAFLGVVLGVLPGALSEVVVAAARALDAGVGPVQLYLWHGVTAALGLSALTVAAGASAFLCRRPIEAWQRRLDLPALSQEGYQALLRGLNRGADRLTGVVQSGSLPVYITVILATAVVVPGWVLVRRTSLPGSVELAESPLQVLVVALVLVAALGTAATRRRFAAVLLLGAVGYGVAVLFVLHGAPDLALTQLLIETLAVVVFVLVLRHLPDQFRTVPWRTAHGLRVAVAVAVGVFVAGFALVSADARSAPPVSEVQAERALPDGGGKNVVNVILTDIRALDTLGEIGVLTVAALGIASLVATAGGSTEGGGDEA